MRRVLAHLVLFWGALTLMTLPRHPHTVAIWGLIALIAALVSDRVLARGEVEFRPRLRWLRRAWRLPGAVLADSRLVAVALVRRRVPDGRFEGVPMDDCSDPSRAALAEVAASVAPNMIALGVDREASVLVVHQLVARERIADESDPLGLR